MRTWRAVAVVGLAAAALTVVAVPASIAGGGSQPRPASSALALLTTPLVTPPAVPAQGPQRPPCMPSTLRVTRGQFKVALGTVVGTYSVALNGAGACALHVEDPNVLSAIDGGAAAAHAVLDSPSPDLT
ncbi:MAG: hypothetical protein JO176_13530, partial [Acidimicrobiia bacterium]|nr:hypothetical protein [Acidimicrobiia bacterium]